MNKENVEPTPAQKIAILEKALAIRLEWEAKQRTPKARFFSALKKLLRVKKAP